MIISKKSLVFGVLVAILVCLQCFAIFMAYQRCERLGYTEIILSFSGASCLKYSNVPGEPVTTSQTNRIEAEMFLAIFLVAVVLFYKRELGNLVLRIRNAYSDGNMTKESLFASFCIFLYLLTILVLVIILETLSARVGEWTFSWLEILPYLASILVAIFMIVVPVSVSIHAGRKALESGFPKTIFRVMPLNLAWSAAIFYVLVEIVALLAESELAAYWIFYGLEYLLGGVLLSIVLALYLYLYKFSQYRSLLQWIAILLALLPVVSILLGRMI